MDERGFVNLLQRFIIAVMVDHRSEHVEDTILMSEIKDELIEYLHRDRL